MGGIAMQSNEHAMQEALRLAQTDAGKQLVELLRKGNRQQLQQVLDSATRGDMAQARQKLDQLLQDPQARQLIDRLGK